MTWRSELAGTSSVFFTVLPCSTCTWYAEIAAPLVVGCFHSTSSCAWSPTGASRFVVGAAGGSGALAGTSASDHGLQLDGSGARFTACTCTWYEMPFSSPVHTRELPVTPFLSATPDGGAGEICRLKDSTGEPGVGGVTHVTVRLASPNFSTG